MQSIGKETHRHKLKEDQMKLLIRFESEQRIWINEAEKKCEKKVKSKIIFKVILSCIKYEREIETFCHCVQRYIYTLLYIPLIFIYVYNKKCFRGFCFSYVS